MLQFRRNRPQDRPILISSSSSGSDSPKKSAPFPEPDSEHSSSPQSSSPRPQEESGRRECVSMGMSQPEWLPSQPNDIPAPLERRRSARLAARDEGVPVLFDSLSTSSAASVGGAAESGNVLGVNIDGVTDDDWFAFASKLDLGAYGSSDLAPYSHDEMIQSWRGKFKV